MATSLALIILLGLLADHLFRFFKLPGLIGMLLVGILLGPNVLNIISPDLMNVSSDFRMIALIVILLRAGLATKKDTLNKVGRTAILMGFIPALFEGAMIALVSPFFFSMSFLEAAILGCAVASVSPAVVVPSMIKFIEDKKGTKKGIPTLLLAASSVDNVFVIVIFSALIGMHEGKQTGLLAKFFDIPVSIGLGITLGIIVGLVLYKFFVQYQPRATKAGMIVIGAAILLTWIEKTLRPYIFVSALSGVIAIGFIILERSESIAHKISQKLGKIWIFAEILIFVLVGAQVNLNVALSAGFSGMSIVILGMLARAIGTFISLTMTDLNLKEKMFCIVSYIPKATVQAAIGAVPLSIGIKSGEIILAIAVMSIIFTAPLGAALMNIAGAKALGE